MRRTQRRCQYYYAMRTVPNLFTLITYVMTRCLDKWTNVLIFMADTLASPVSTWKAQTQRNPAVSTLHPSPAHSPRCGEFAKPCQSASARCDCETTIYRLLGHRLLRIFWSDGNKTAPLVPFGHERRGKCWQFCAPYTVDTLSKHAF